jgi:hypothetical protein
LMGCKGSVVELFRSCIAYIEDFIANLEVDDSRTFYVMSG